MIAKGTVWQCRRTVKVGGVHLIPYSRNNLQDRDAALWQFVKQMVAAIAWLINTDIVVAAYARDAYLAFLCLYLHPLYVREESLKLRILKRLTWYWVVIIVVPVAKLWTMQAVLPYSVRTIAHP